MVSCLSTLVIFPLPRCAPLAGRYNTFKMPISITNRFWQCGISISKLVVLMLVCLNVAFWDHCLLALQERSGGIPPIFSSKDWHRPGCLSWLVHGKPSMIMDFSTHYFYFHVKSWMAHGRAWSHGSSSMTLTHDSS